jgi:hypothetical protein
MNGGMTEGIRYTVNVDTAATGNFCNPGMAGEDGDVVKCLIRLV